MRFIAASHRPWEPASHEDANDPGVWKRVIATKEELMPGRVQMVNWAKLPPGRSFARHYHEDMQEVFVLVRGQATMTVSGQTQCLQPGDTMVVAPREVHEMKNVGADDVEYLVFGVSSEQDGKTIVVDG